MKPTSRECVTNYEIATEAHPFDSLQKDKETKAIVRPFILPPIETDGMKETMAFDEWRGPNILIQNK